MNKTKQPLDQINWLHRDMLKPNNYNPNKVAPTELNLLKTSIKEDGWTQPIVINPDMTIVDGFHRWTVSSDKEIYALTDGKVPTVTITPKDSSHQQMATIRHNRARGTHGVLEMSNITTDLINEGLSGEEIMKKLGMEKEEVTRLLFRAGIPKSEVFKDKEFSKSWNPK
ncbi:chromosome partitioning protein ParB [Yeosuana sp.]|uniref:chromosome partitioning protein ParB n=1 Tax=Yeosuana sp. TaxID=2529388 RepID=UPI004054F8FF